MSKEIKDKAKEYLKAQLSVIPTKEDKTPALPTWKPYQSQRIKEEAVDSLFNTAKGLGIICGAVSDNLEVIDVDCKYDITGSLWEELIGLVEDNLPDLYKSLVIAKTVKGGYHIYYRCSSIARNLKLSNRSTNDQEREETYKKEIGKGATQVEAKRIADNERKVLVETRGEGGYVIAPPTPGYTYVQGDPINIPTITLEEREILLSIGRSFNEPVQEEPKEKTDTIKNLRDKYPGKTSLEDYDERGDVVGLLQANGWREVKATGERVYLLRPGQTDAKYSANYHKSKRSLIVFSTSTQFEEGKPYSPSQVYNLLVCFGDWSKTALELGKQGYGDYKPSFTKGKNIKTERIKVEAINKVNRVTSVISSPGENLKTESLETAVGEEVVITSPGIEAQEEILKAIELIQETGKRIYVKEGGSEMREYRYQLKAIFYKYGMIQEKNGGLTDRDKDNLLDEVIIASTKLQPIDKDVFLKEFIGIEAIKELGISEESLSITVDRLTSTRDKEAQATEFRKLLSRATELQDKGETDKALELLDSKVKEVKLKDKATEFSILMKPIKEEDIRERQSNKPESLKSGYTIGGEELLLPSGAISIFTAPTSHGKTTLLINLALNVAQAYPDKEAYLFSYEEDSDSILINTLNTYMDEEISQNNRRTLKSYFNTGSLEYVKNDSIPFFEASKKTFFKDLIETKRLNIHYSNYNSDTLIEAIRYLHKHANPGAIFIDYIQLLNLPEGKYKTYSRQEEIKEICIALKDVAVETGLPIILGAQFNREVVNQLRIHATKIGEAGDIERIANLIVGFWNNNFKPLATDGELNEINKKEANTPDTLYVTILKNRGGRVGLEEILSFNGNTGKIKNNSNSYFK